MCVFDPPFVYLRMEKEWYDIDGYEGVYQINKHGDVKSKARKGTKGGLIKPFVEEYLCVVLTKGMVSKKKRVHRLLAQTFIPNPNKKPQVNHIDGNKLNNKLSNLEWCTNSENQKHAYAKGLSIPRSGEKNGNSKLTRKDVEEIRSIASSRGRHYGRKELSLRYGVSECCIKEVVNRRRNTWK